MIEAVELSDLQAAASDLIDAAVPGGAVIAQDADIIVRELRNSLHTAPSMCIQYLIAVLYWIAVWSKVWRTRAERGDTSSPTLTGVDYELSASAEISLAIEVVPSFVNDPDPQTRAMAYLFMGVACEDLSSANKLIGWNAAERDALARACNVQSVLSIASRLPEAKSDRLMLWVTRQIEISDLSVAERVYRELSMPQRAQADRDRITARLGPTAERIWSRHPGNWSWPAENI